MPSLLIQAGSFAERGGWVLETRSMLQMGSSYLMAHGFGVPVADAVTTVEIPAAGRWRFLARTRDWTKVWKRGKPAGLFQLRVNDAPLSETLGTNGPRWSWQRAGEMTLPAGPCRLALRDLSGFNGRVDAIYLTTNPDDVPPDEGIELERFRRDCGVYTRREADETYDLIVAGGGIAGICATLAATRTGAKVLLLQDRPVLGGCNSSEIRVVLGGFAHTEYYPNLGNIVHEVGPTFGCGAVNPAEYYEDYRKASVFKLQSESRCLLRLNECVVAVEKEGDRLTAAISRNTMTGQETRWQARLFADCTGDAVLARLAGAETLYGTEGREKFNESLAPEKERRQVMGHSVLWSSRDTGTPSPFPEIDWGLEFDEDKVYYVDGGHWEWESGQYRDQVEEAEYIRDYGLMTIFANWSYLKNRSRRKAEWANKKIEWISPIGGKRESHRVIGDHVLTQNDIEEGIIHPDATGGMTWDIDLHYPDPENEAKFPEPFRSCAYHRGIKETYPVPYRCLYARDLRNLFLGGRHISVSHVAFACVRVMRTLGILGEVIGLAAALCTEKNAWPRDIYEQHFEDLKKLMEKGVELPTYFAWPAHNNEFYAFKEVGHHLQLTTERKELPPGILEKIKALNLTHKLKDPTYE